MVDATPVQSVGSEPAGPSFVFVTANDVGFVSNFGFRVSGLPVSVHSSHSQASGNPVKIGDGCATVTGYRLPRATGSERNREGGSEVICPKSGYRLGCARRGSAQRNQLLRQEKDEASPWRVCAKGFDGCLHSPFCRGLKVFLWVSPDLRCRATEVAGRAEGPPKISSRFRSGLSIVNRKY
jgi:hypothetical protein